ncbi:MAG: hypothetical protein AAFW97_14560 [Pseudomonadota bacterium]
MPLRKLEDCSLNDLAENAKLLGAELEPGMDEAAIIKVIRDIDPTIAHLDIPEDISNPSRSAVAAAHKDPSHYLNDPKATIIIRATDDEGGNLPWDIAHNGMQFRVQRDVEVEIPYRLLSVLQDAVQTKYKLVGRPGVDQKLLASNSPAVPFSVVKPVPQQEIDGWFERTKDIGKTPAELEREAA